MRVNNLELNQRYLSFLEDFQKHCKIGGRFSSRDLIVKHRINNAVSGIMNDGGIVRMIGRGPSVKYVWNSKNPDIHMAIELRKRAAEYTKKSVSKHRNVSEHKSRKAINIPSVVEMESQEITPIKQRKPRTKSTVETKQRTISVLWGAFKITY